MSSTINTSAVNVNYPVPGINNSSQGFRDNFTAIKTNLDTAGTEITNLQQNVLVKAALTGTTVNNNMNDTLISNALTRSFRASTYNLGNSLSGTVTIDVSLGDVQYGAIAGDTTLNFTGWAVEGMQSNVELQLAISNANAVVSFSSAVSSNNCYGVSTLENYVDNFGTATVTIPYGVCQLDYRLSSVDCGTTITIEPYNRPRRSTQIRQRTPAPTGFTGDISGTVSVDANYIYVCSGTYDSTEIPLNITATYAGNRINCVSTTGLFLNSPILFSGYSDFTNIVAGDIYYIKSIVDGSNITISSTGFDGVAGDVVELNAQLVTMSAISYNGTPIWKRIDLATTTGDQVVTGNLSVNGIATFANVGNLRIGGPGNVNGYFLQTNGTGNLSWAAGGASGSGTPGGANTQIQYNAGNGNFAGYSGFTFNSATSLLSAPGAITSVGNITSGNVLTAVTLAISSNAAVTGNLTVTQNVVGTTVTSTGLLTGGNIFTLGNATVTGNINASYINGFTYGDHEGPTGAIAANTGNFTTIAASSTISATGNITGGNISVTGNASAANVISTGYLLVGAATALTAIGSTQTTALALTKSINVITSAAASTGAILPVAQAGMRIIVRNGAANAISVYPNLNATIGANAANIAYALPISTSIEYYCANSAVSNLGGQWYTLL